MIGNASNPPLLGDQVIENELFKDIDLHLTRFKSPEFHKLPSRRRFKEICETLLDLIRKAPHESFLLPAVIDFLDRINHTEVLEGTFHINMFEFWLNHFADLKAGENALIRGKIMGKYIPRDDYQAFFPVGMDKTFYGSHFVAAHLSPDVDTTIASFFGWMDAFSAKIGSGQHMWSLPGGPPDATVTSIFKELFGRSVFEITARTAPTLTLTAMDLVTSSNVSKAIGTTSISSIDHGFNDKAVILVDDGGHCLGDWHTSDVEFVRQIIVLFKSSLRWFENNLHVKLITLFAKPNLKLQDIPPFIASLFEVKIGMCETVQEFTEKQQTDLNAFLSQVIGLPKGMQSTFADLYEALQKLDIPEMPKLQLEIKRLVDASLFDSQGNLKEDRPSIFNRIEKIIHELDKAILHARNYAERLSVAIDIKTKVLNHPPIYANMRSDVEDIRLKIKSHDYITVVAPEGQNALYPVGVVWASDLRKTYLGTVSFRDFCNQDEVKMASYLTVISVVDHHKSNLKTGSPPMALLGDTQSCNVIVAEQSFLINDRYSLGGLSARAKSSAAPTSPAEARILRRILQRDIANHSRGSYFIHPIREYIEYYCFLQAILDDTDLLTKVSARDVECVAELLNRMKSLASGQEVEIINLDGLKRDENFAKMAAKRILHDPDMYSLYHKIYAYKEKEINKSLRLCGEGKSSALFSDTKEQNNCCRIGQIKLFSTNISIFETLRENLRQKWLNSSQKRFQEQPELDLHLMMISTIASADETYENFPSKYPHQDELWIWIAPTTQAATHLASFLSAFQNAAEIIKNTLEIGFIGDHTEILEETFAHNFPPLPRKWEKPMAGPYPMAVLFYNAGSINSRKSMISPYLPRLIS